MSVDGERPSIDGVEFWAETRLREALETDNHVMMALAHLKVGLDVGQTPVEAMRVALAGFVFDALGVDVKDRGGPR